MCEKVHPSLDLVLLFVRWEVECGKDLFNSNKNVKSLCDLAWNTITIMRFFFQEVNALRIQISILQNVKHERIVSYYGSQQNGKYLDLFTEFMPGVRA